MNGSTRTDLFVIPSTVIMECTDDGLFSVLGTVPDWFARLYPAAASGRKKLRLGEKFPRLDSFLCDAESFWLTADGGWLRSQPWSEMDTSGNECQLEATAMCLRNRKILLIESLDDLCQEKRLN